jgi:hypothetical protein
MTGSGLCNEPPTIRSEVEAASQQAPLTDDNVLYHSLRMLASAEAFWGLSEVGTCRMPGGSVVVRAVLASNPGLSETAFPPACPNFGSGVSRDRSNPIDISNFPQPRDPTPGGTKIRFCYGEYFRGAHFRRGCCTGPAAHRKVPNRREVSQAGDINGKYDYWFDGGACLVVIGVDGI